MEAYRASFGFSADEIITTPQYVEISDVVEDSFTMEESVEAVSTSEGHKTLRIHTSLQSQNGFKLKAGESLCCDRHEDGKSRRQPGNVPGSSTTGNHALMTMTYFQRWHHPESVGSIT